MDNSPSGASSASSATSWSRLAAIELCLDLGAGGGVVGAENRRAGGDGVLLVERGACGGDFHRLSSLRRFRFRSKSISGREALTLITRSGFPVETRNS